MEYKATIGLEIHAELKTRSKMFCSCKNDPDEKRPNTNVCPVCLAHPGTLPVINKEAVKKVLQVGLAVGGKLADFTEFDRKNYFYPDIPKGYQISQYKYPLVSGGELASVALTRIHLEEDTARSDHTKGDYSLVDFNRSGVPLMELVTEPVIHTASQAMNFGRELQLLLQYLGVSEANMEKGEMRVEVNISISNTDKLGTKVEVKNINSFSAAGKAIEYELHRQSELLANGEKVTQETRGWDETKNQTFSQRSKEDAHDYRYFPDPDLPKLKISEISELAKESLLANLPETPEAKRSRLIALGIKMEDVETYINNRLASNFFEAAAGKIGSDQELLKTASNFITSDLIGLSKTNGTEFTAGQISPQSFANLLTMFKGGELSSRGVKDIIQVLFQAGGDPKLIAQEKGLIQQNDPALLEKIMSELVANNPELVAQYKAGKESVLQFLVGQGMKATKGAGNPQILQEIVKNLLK